MPSKPARVLVTGASRGIGLAIATRLAGAGYAVIALARTKSVALDAAIATANGKLRFHPFDLSEIDAIPEMVRTLKSEHGPLWGLVNNAGMSLEGLLPNVHNAQIEQLIRLNVTSPVVLTKYVVRGMLTGDGGRIINLSSVIGSTGYAGLSVYAASKAALIGFTKSLAREVGPQGITVNALAPGFVETEMTASLGGEDRERVRRRSALRRLAEAEDVAAMAEFLMGNGGKNITGAVLTIDAGNTA